MIEPQYERIEWQKKYLKVLLERGENTGASNLCGQIEADLNRRYARPAWLRLARIRLDIRSGNFAIAEAERYTGIAVSDFVTRIKPPGVERFNDVLHVMKLEGHNPDLFAAGFFARHLALGNYEPANFTELARILFRQNKHTEALDVLNLMVNVNRENTRAEAMAEIADLDVVKRYAADSARIVEAQHGYMSLNSGVLETAASVAAEFGQTDAAVDFRRAVLETFPDNTQNKLELARLLATRDEKAAANELLAQITVDRDVPRVLRWRAKWQMRLTDTAIEIADIRFDPYSQFYSGLIYRDMLRSSDAASFFTNSLIAGNEAEKTAIEELVKMYIATEKYDAAFELAESGNFENPADMFRLLSQAAEKTGDFGKAIDFEKLRSGEGDPDRLAALNRLFERSQQRATDLVIDLENTRKL